MFTIAKRFDWSSSHVLAGLPGDHPCSRLHGHNYEAVVTLAADELDAVGFVVDYRALGAIKAWIDDHLDHRHLNDVSTLAGANPTAEFLAESLFYVAAAALGDVRPDALLLSVTVKETSKTSATFEPARPVFPGRASS